MDMIERYLYAVSRKLPIKQRQDIEDELRSLILDNLDDRCASDKPTEEDITAVLLELGPPDKVAASYRNEDRYLIGPKLFDIYYLVVRIAMGGTAFGLLIVHTINLIGANSAIEILKELGQYLASLISTLFGVVGAITIVFWLIQRFVDKPIELDLNEGKPWHPSSLPEKPEKEEQVKPIETIFTICFTVLALILFSLFHDKLGIYYVTETGWEMIPIFSQEALAAYIPAWSVLWVLSLALHVWLLRDGRWKMESRIADIGISVLNIGILIYMLSGPMLFSQELLSGTNFPSMQPLFEMIPIGIRVVFALAILGTVIEIIKKIIKLVK